MKQKLPLFKCNGKDIYSWEYHGEEGYLYLLGKDENTIVVTIAMDFDDADKMFDANFSFEDIVQNLKNRYADKED